MPYITQAYLIKGSVLRTKLSQVSLYMDEGGMDADMVFCRSIRDQVAQTSPSVKAQPLCDFSADVSLNFMQTNLNVSTGSLHVPVQP